MGRNEQLTPSRIISAIHAARGMITIAADSLGCHPETIRNYAKRHATVEQALREARDRTTDMAESKLFDAINAGESWAIQFYLRSQGKDRGYNEQINLRIQIEQTARQIADEFAMTPAEILAEAEAYLLEASGAR
jgi:hypothetical protein